jgi:predicted nucleotidyltransferase
MTTEALWQLDTCEQISRLISGQPEIRALWLGGSLARDEADRFSDIDLVALIADATLDKAGSNIETLLGSKFELVLVRNRGDEQHRLLNFVTDEWKRFDLNIFTADGIGRSELRGLRPLFDKDGLDLPVGHGAPPQREVSAEQVYFTVSEFMRVLGLLPVVMHRRDFVAAVSGSALLREHLVTILQYERAGQIRTGALNDTKSLTPAAASAVLGLPALRAEESSIIDFNRSCWDVLLQFGPRISQQYHAEWPGRLVGAVRARLARDLDMTVQPFRTEP